METIIKNSVNFTFRVRNVNKVYMALILNCVCDGYKEHVKGIHIFGEKYLQQDEWDIQTIDSRAKELAGLM